MFRQLEQAGQKVQTLAELEPLLLGEHSVLLSWLDDAAQALAPALIATEYLLDPEAIIIGGIWPARLVKALALRLEDLLPPLRIKQKTYSPLLICAEAGEDVAALVPIYSTLAPHLLLLNKSSQSASETLTLAGRRSV